MPVCLATARLLGLDLVKRKQGLRRERDMDKVSKVKRGQRVAQLGRLGGADGASLAQSAANHQRCEIDHRSGDGSCDIQCER